MKTLTKTRKPKTPPGRFDSMPSIQRSPSTPRNTRLNTVEPTRMNITMVGELERGVHCLLEQLPGQAPVHDRERQGADRAHRAALGRRGKADQDRAEHHEDQHQRRHHRHHAADEQPPRLAVRTSFGSAGTLSGQTMPTMKIQRQNRPTQNEARDEGAGIHVADRLAHRVGQHHQHQRRRNDLGDGAGGGDDAGCHLRIVAVARHHRQRDQPHGDDRGRDRAGDRAEQRADEDDRIGEAAAHRAEQLAHRVEQVLGEPAALQDRAHEGEERDRQQQLVGGDAEDALGQRLQQHEVEIAELDGKEAEAQAHRRERERDRIADEQDDDQPREHQRRHQLE